MDAEPPEPGPILAQFTFAQASSGITNGTSYANNEVGREEHVRTHSHSLPDIRTPVRDPAGREDGSKSDSVAVEVDEEENSVPSGLRIDTANGQNASVLHLRRQSIRILENVRNAPVIDRSVVQDEQSEATTGTLLPSVPTSPRTTRSGGSINQQPGLRGKKLFRKTIWQVMLQVRLRQLAERLRNPKIGVSLCTSCSDLNLRLDDFFVGRRPTWANRDEQRLGLLQDIYSRSQACRLCRLVINAFEEQLDPRQHPDGIKAAVKSYNRECSISWQTDGTQVEFDKYGKSTEIPLTRRICIKWPGNRYNDAYLILAYPNTVLGPERDFLGRFQSSLDKTVPEKLKEWYEICCNSHKQCKSRIADADLGAQFDTLRTEPYFGVVDLHEMRLTSLPPGAKYVALSYVWGDKTLRDEKFKTKIEFVESLKKKNGLKHFFESLPLTIQDATRVVRSLGLRYLWVDALSIIQDDDEFWSLNASKMHLIYGNAEITIYAADGDGGNSGIKAFTPLPGKYELHYEQHVEYIKEDLNLMVWNPFERFLERSTWNTRAWTFQEYELSRRRLVFVEGRAYFQCPTTTMSLDKYSEHTLHGIRPSALEEYRKSVSQYTPRRLTHEKDVEVAFSGIGFMLCKNLGGEQLFCLPTSHFDWAILWQPESAPLRRVPEPGERYAFPSWSWCGWKSTKMGYPSSFTAGCELDISDWLMRHTWISWYVRDRLGNLNIVWRPSTHQPASDDDRTTGYRSTPEKDDWFGRALSQRYKDLERSVFHKTMPRWPFNVRINSSDYISTSPSQRFLQFWTWSAQFSITPEDAQKPSVSRSEKPGQGLTNYCILDSDSEIAGRIILPEDFIEQRGRKHEFIALSEAKPFTQHEAEVWNHWETAQRENTEWYLYYVMLLAYEAGQSLVAQRAGVGKMFKRAFDPPVSISTARTPSTTGRVMWKEVILG